MLGLYPSATLEDVINGNSSLREIIVKAPSGIDFIPGATGTSAMASLSPCEHAGLIDSFNELTNEYDYLLVDTAAGLSDAVLSFMRSSQEIIVVICDEPTSITDAYALIKVMHKKYRVNRFNIVTNFVQSAEEGKSLFNKLFRVSDKFLNVSLNYIGAIPFDKKLQQGIKLQAPVVSRYPNACSTKAFIKLAESVRSLPWQTELNSNPGFFIQQMVYG
jgi:flagellar biosynthesis protein FlhG